ncbi:ArnT family glycosyltransferase [Salinimicrobium xinjiangense]|uniref:ArnT family glycosyltransferase n=1 Tax=Salinimicrobium xinjiangense TaxID=438596 RepID=UPI0003FFA9EB|nr:glycosyltransferase family 39 protein [Salinimicrobium xinjiangense]
MLLDKKYLWIIIGVWALIFLPHLDLLYINIMEARNFITAREMVNENNWLLTTLNLEPRYEKPPLPTWLTAISGMILGFSNFALRLPAALVTLLLLIYFYKFSLVLKISEKQSFLGSLILATSFYIIFMGRNGQWDIFTHAFMLLSIYYLWQLFSLQKNLWKSAFLGGIFFGCSILSKGPVSPYALLLPFLLAYGSVYKFRDMKQIWKPLLLYLVTGIVAGTWWFLYVRIADPEAFIEITTREASRWTSYNVRPFYYYWSFFIQSGIWCIPAFVALLYPYLKNRVSDKKAYQFSLFWTLSAVILLSLIPEKKSRYLLPVLIPMALNTSFYVAYLFRRFKDLPLKEQWIVYFNHGIIAVLGISFPVAAFFVLELEDHWIWYILTSVTLFGIGGATLYYLKKQFYPIVFYLTIAFMSSIIIFGFPLSEALLDNPRFRTYAELREKIQEKKLPLYLYGDPAPELIWDYGSPIPVLSEYELDQLGNHFGILLEEKDTVILKELGPQYLIKSSERYDLNQVSPGSSGYKDRLVRWFYVLEVRSEGVTK